MKAITKDNVIELMSDAIYAKDDKLMEGLTLKALQIYLDNPVDFNKHCLGEFGELLDTIAFLTGQEIEIFTRNRRLVYVLSQMVKIGDETDEKGIHVLVLRLIKYLNNMDYESV